MDFDADIGIDDLNRAYGIEDKVSFQNRFGGTVAVLKHANANANAIVALQGAQVLSYNTDGLGELLWLSPVAKLGTGKAVRGGIPVCWPWFGPHPDGGDRPAHGLVRARPWVVAATDAGPDGSRISLELGPCDTTSPDWPEGSIVRIDIRLADSLAISLTTRNSGPQSICVTQALHTYFAVGGIETVRITGLEGVSFIDQLDRSSLKREHAPVTFSREIDRIYQEQTGSVILEDRGAARLIEVNKTGSASSVVWNPWIDKSVRLGDMGQDGYRRMVCIETANAGADIVTIPRGGAHVLTATYRAARMP